MINNPYWLSLSSSVLKAEHVACIIYLCNTCRPTVCPFVFVGCLVNVFYIVLFWKHFLILLYSCAGLDEGGANRGQKEDRVYHLAKQSQCALRGVFSIALVVITTFKLDENKAVNSVGYRFQKDCW